MPFIHVRACSGRDTETKKKLSEAIVKAASEAMGAPEAAFTVVYEDIERENWEKDVIQKVVKPLGDNILIERGKPVSAGGCKNGKICKHCACAQITLKV